MKKIKPEKNKIIMSGNYPPGSEHDSSAPWNQEDPKYIICPDCNGKSAQLLEAACSCHVNAPCYKCENSCLTCENIGEIEDTSSPDDYLEDYDD